MWNIFYRLFLVELSRISQHTARAERREKAISPSAYDKTKSES